MVFGDENLAFMAVLAPYILKSVNGGESWYEVPLNTSDMLGVGYLSFPSSEIGYGAGYDKLMKTTDSGESWQLAAPLTNSITDIHFFDEDLGWLACFGGGVLLKVDPFEYQFNPPVNFTLEQGYNAPNTIFYLEWDEPEVTDSINLTGYNIYRNDTLLLTLEPDENNYEEELNPFGGWGEEICYYITAIYEDPDGESTPTEELCGGWLTGNDENIYNNTLFSCKPNPFTNQINIYSSDSKKWSELEIEIFDHCGNFIMSYKIKGYKSGNNISTSYLRPGIYYLSITTDKGFSETKKLLKMR
jgi:hypothetical protein